MTGLAGWLWENALPALSATFLFESGRDNDPIDRAEPGYHELQLQPGSGDAARKPRIIDSCHAYASDGLVVKEAWPEFYTGS